MRKAHARALAGEPGLEGDCLVDACERHSVRLSLDNLTTFPFVRNAVASGTLSLHGWFLDIFKGELEFWNSVNETFDTLN